MSEQIIRTEFSDLMQKSYIDYAMSVICQRALPDARDGLKPVQRRVLYAMSELGLSHDKPHRKSARIVGDAMGKDHPHGDSSIYEALVVMAQDFKKGRPLVDGHGNFGSIEGDGAAAMRYTEARLQKFTEDVYLSDMDKDVVDYIPNFDETEKEPLVLPVRVPNLLLNGADGIAVGMTTSIPPHNLGEIVDGEIAYLDNPDITVEGLMQYIKGPDFPTGGIVINQKDLKHIYETGSGKIKLRGKVKLEKSKRKSGRDKLVITEIPYTMVGANIGKFIEDVLGLIENKVTTDITDISNESSKEGIRIVLELKRNADVERLKNILYKKTRLEDTFGVNMLAIEEGRPERLSLRDIIRIHSKFQYEITRRLYQTLLKRANEQKEIKEGLIKACDMIDLIIEILRGSKNLKQAKRCLIYGDITDINFKTKKSAKEASKLSFTERQATAILEMRLYRLIGLEILTLKKEYDELVAKIGQYEDILNNPESMKKVIKADLRKIKRKYDRNRRTSLENAKAAVITAAPIEEREVYFVMDRFGYGKLLESHIYDRNQETVQKEYRDIVPCMNTDKLCFFTDQGLMHQIRVEDIPAGRLRDKGVPIDNLGNYDSRTERILTVIPSMKLAQYTVLFVTEQSMVKIVDGSEYQVSRKKVQATKLAEGDKVTAVLLLDHTNEDTQVILQSAEGYFLRFPLSEITQKKKSAIGIEGMKLGKEDYIREVYLWNKEDEGMNSILYKEKELPFSKIRMMSRDSKGVKIRR